MGTMKLKQTLAWPSYDVEVDAERKTELNENAVKRL
jgi:hypothetical protein